ncbi:hypothetical protein TNCV_4956021 [Trichonephila clavipes]|nr:hypothetical protein TNCV_4956021 [Trichonephila clavipes]
MKAPKVNIYDKNIRNEVARRLTNTTNEHCSKTRGHETTPQRVKGGIEDVSIEMDNEFQRLPILDEIPRVLLLSAS